VKRALLDINVLLALFDSDHVDHERARDWLNDEIADGWASCAITQNGFVRILSQPNYPGPVSMSEALELLTDATSTHHHEYWSCSVSLTDDAVVDRSRIHGHRQLTDIYLLALAAANNGRFVTFDTSIPLDAVRTASKDDLVIL
jgi:uncharacterized protein